MDLYRYFHPHHNPRLRNTPLRLQELGELTQAANELKRALERARLRSEDHPIGGIREEHFSDILVAMSYVAESLSTLTQAHPGDEHSDMFQLLRERQNAPGWENWSRLVQQRLNILDQYYLAQESPRRIASSK